MERKIKIVELNYHCHLDMTDPLQVIAKHKPSNLFFNELLPNADIVLVKHFATEDECMIDNIRYKFFKRSNRFFQLSSSTHQFVAAESPDVVLVQGLIYPLQVMALRKKIGKQCTIILQHHAEPPFRRKRVFQRIADKSIDGYLFTSLENAGEWLQSSIINNRNKCFEMPAASTAFKQQDKVAARKMTGMTGETNFLWVGRLNANKDPVTVLKAFDRFIEFNPGAKLYMIYQENDLLPSIRLLIEQQPGLKKQVILVGKKPYRELEQWYSAADYIISASHHEGGSYVIMEAMACGCVPIVSNIPASMKMIERGNMGYFFQPGNAEDLLVVLLSLQHQDYRALSARVKQHFLNYISPGAIATRFMEIYSQLK